MPFRSMSEKINFSHSIIFATQPDDEEANQVQDEIVTIAAVIHGKRLLR